MMAMWRKDREVGSPEAGETSEKPRREVRVPKPGKEG